MKKLSYEFNWTHNFDNWNTAHTSKLLEIAKSRILELEETIVNNQLETTDFSEANKLISLIKSKK